MELTPVMADDIRDLTGERITLVLTDNTRISGIMKGVNSKGVRLVPDGATKEITRALSRISAVVTEEVEDTRTERDYESEVAAFFTEDATKPMAEDPATFWAKDVDSERDFEGDMTVITMESGEIFEADDVLNADVETADETTDGDEVELIAEDEEDEDISVKVPDDVSDIALPGSVSTPAQLAAIFGTSAYELRKVLRALGLNVGKGKKYDLSTLTTKELTTIREKVMAK